MRRFLMGCLAPGLPQVRAPGRPGSAPPLDAAAPRSPSLPSPPCRMANTIPRTPPLSPSTSLCLQEGARSEWQQQRRSAGTLVGAGTESPRAALSAAPPPPSPSKLPLASSSLSARAFPPPGPHSMEAALAALQQPGSPAAPAGAASPRSQVALACAAGQLRRRITPEQRRKERRQAAKEARDHLRTLEALGRSRGAAPPPPAQQAAPARVAAAAAAGRDATAPAGAAVPAPPAPPSSCGSAAAMQSATSHPSELGHAGSTSTHASAAAAAVPGASTADIAAAAALQGQPAAAAADLYIDLEVSADLALQLERAAGAAGAAPPPGGRRSPADSREAVSAAPTASFLAIIGSVRGAPAGSAGSGELGSTAASRSPAPGAGLEGAHPEPRLPAVDSRSALLGGEGSPSSAPAPYSSPPASAAAASSGGRRGGLRQWRQRLQQKPARHHKAAAKQRQGAPAAGAALLELELTAEDVQARAVPPRRAGADENVWP